GAAHFRAEDDVHPGELGEGEDDFFHRDVRGVWDFGDVEFFQRFAGHDFGGDFGPGDAGRLRDEGDRAAGAGVDLNEIDFIVLDGVLDVHEAADAEGGGEFSRLALQFLDDGFGEGVGGQRAGGVAGVDAGFFDVFHDAADQR